MKKTFAIALICFSITLFPLLIQAEEKAQHPKLAVKTLTGSGIDEETASTLTEVLCTRLMTHKKYNILCASDVKAILEATAQSALLGKCENDDCFSQFGKAVDAPFVLTGKIGKVKKTYVITLSMISTKEKKVIKRIQHDIDEDDSLIKGINKAADLLMK